MLLSHVAEVIIPRRNGQTESSSSLKQASRSSCNASSMGCIATSSHSFIHSFVCGDLYPTFPVSKVEPQLTRLKAQGKPCPMTPKTLLEMNPPVKGRGSRSGEEQQRRRPSVPSLIPSSISGHAGRIKKTKQSRHSSVDNPEIDGPEGAL